MSSIVQASGLISYQEHARDEGTITGIRHSQGTLIEPLRQFLVIDGPVEP